ncbi:MAG: GNAT family N-acetyltransferase [Acidobacteriota bacterium]|nr:GNAT family N-acetyltransferase [Acidobacteriota bacterium]
MEFRELATDIELSEAFPLMSQLRDRIRRDTFLADVRRQQVEGYRIYGGFEEGRLVSLAGVRRTHTLFRGEHLFVDDLVTSEHDRGKGHGRALLAWLAEQAEAQGIRRVYLDSRFTAKGFYEKVGFTLQTSIPCWIDVDNETLRPRAKESAGQ